MENYAVKLDTRCCLTKSEAANLKDFIEFNLFDYIRRDTEIDNIVWLEDMLSIYHKCMGMSDSYWEDKNGGSM